MQYRGRSCPGTRKKNGDPIFFFVTRLIFLVHIPFFGARPNFFFGTGTSPYVFFEYSWVCELQLHDISHDKLLAIIPNYKRASHCRAHNVAVHHFFLNYRVACEKEVVEEIYKVLACAKLKHGTSVHVFWDSKCLNYGQNWEKGFLGWLQRSRVIVLFISATTLAGIRIKAHTGQDNVLVEYHISHSLSLLGWLACFWLIQMTL